MVHPIFKYLHSLSTQVSGAISPKFWSLPWPTLDLDKKSLGMFSWLPCCEAELQVPASFAASRFGLPAQLLDNPWGEQGTAS